MSIHRMMDRNALLAILGSWAIVSGGAVAATVPFTENFAIDAANWRDSTGTVILTWNAAGGPDGGAHVSGTFNFVNSTTVDTPALFRAQDEYGSSNGEFVGNWVADGVQSVCAFVRHDAGVPMTFFFRYASPSNFPGAVSVTSPPVPSGEWTRISVPIPDPTFIFEGPFTYQQVFSNIGHLQIGVTVPGSLAGVDQSFTFDLDKVRISDRSDCPEAPAISAMGGVTLGLLVLVAGCRILKRRVPSDRVAL